MHDSFPQAMELSEKGYNAFALIYRPGADTACEDLARAIAFLHENAEELQIDMTDYSLWGGSAGARMAAWLGSYGTAAFGEDDYPAPASVIMQYTGLSEVTGNEPPTYACVGTNDGIASYRSVENYIRRIKNNGTDTEIEVFDGLQHGFGLGEGTVAEGWINNAVDFGKETWDRQNDNKKTERKVMIMKAKKLLSMILIGAASVSLLAGCGSNTSDTQADSEDAAQTESSDNTAQADEQESAEDNTDSSSDPEMYLLFIIRQRETLRKLQTILPILQEEIFLNWNQ